MKFIPKEEVNNRSFSCNCQQILVKYTLPIVPNNFLLYYEYLYKKSTFCGEPLLGLYFPPTCLENLRDGMSETMIIPGNPIPNNLHKNIVYYAPLTQSELLFIHIRKVDLRNLSHKNEIARQESTLPAIFYSK